MADNFTPGESIPVIGNSSTSTSGIFSTARAANFPDVKVMNAGSSIVFIGLDGPANLPAVGVSNATPLGPGEDIILRKGIGVKTCSVLFLSGNGTVYFTAGQGN